MEYRRFGRTGLMMPLFSCGGMRFQWKWQDTPLEQIPPENQANLQATVRRAWDLGITHIETARGYGSSERQLGLVLPSLPREKLIVQTKIVPEADPALFLKHFDESLERLRLDYVDLLALHGINNDDVAQKALGPDGRGGCLRAARQLQRQGRAKHIGFSTHAPSDLLLSLIDHPHNGGFDYVNLHWYWIFQKNAPAIQAATQRDMGVFIISPSDKGGKLYAPPEKLTRLCQPLHPMAFNDLFCLSHREVHTLSVGAARPSDFDTHVEALKWLPRARELLGPILTRLESSLHQHVPEALRDPFSLPIPPWELTPGQINIPVILWLRNLVDAFDMREYAEMRYNLLGNGGHWFPGKNAADAEHVDLEPIARMAGIRELVPLLTQTHALLAKAPAQRLSQS
ncbi:MAG TPA: aldo/keto reductase [Phycisphaerae bacterium]|nr:aldo/keto reductase [Phycisphaerae bacterium]